MEKTFQLQPTLAAGMDADGRLYFFENGRLVQLNVATGMTTQLAFQVLDQKPSCINVFPNGVVAIGCLGAVHFYQGGTTSQLLIRNELPIFISSRKIICASQRVFTYDDAFQILDQYQLSQGTAFSALESDGNILIGSSGSRAWVHGADAPRAIALPEYPVQALAVTGASIRFAAGKSVYQHNPETDETVKELTSISRVWALSETAAGNEHGEVILSRDEKVGLFDARVTFLAELGHKIVVMLADGSVAALDPTQLRKISLTLTEPVCEQARPYNGIQTMMKPYVFFSNGTIMEGERFVKKFDSHFCVVQAVRFGDAIICLHRNGMISADVQCFQPHCFNLTQDCVLFEQDGQLFVLEITVSDWRLKMYKVVLNCTQVHLLFVKNTRLFEEGSAAPQAVRSLTQAGDTIVLNKKIAFRVDAGPAKEAVRIIRCRKVSGMELNCACHLRRHELIAAVSEDEHLQIYDSAFNLLYENKLRSKARSVIALSESDDSFALVVGGCVNELRFLSFRVDGAKMFLTQCIESPYERKTASMKYNSLCRLDDTTFFAADSVGILWLFCVGKDHIDNVMQINIHQVGFQMAVCAGDFLCVAGSQHVLAFAVNRAHIQELIQQVTDGALKISFQEKVVQGVTFQTRSGLPEDHFLIPVEVEKLQDMGSAQSVDVTPSGELVAGFDSGYVCVFQLKNNAFQCTARHFATHSAILCLAAAPDGMLFCYGWDRILREFEYAEGRGVAPVRTYHLSVYQPHRVLLSDTHVVVVGYGFQQIERARGTKLTSGPF